MTRGALEHLLRAAAALTNERDFVVIGSQAILGQFPTAADDLLVSVEADLAVFLDQPVRNTRTQFPDHDRLIPGVRRAAATTLWRSSDSASTTARPSPVSR